MPQPCSICTHADRKRIDAALVEGMPTRRIAAQFGVAETSLRRHRNAHLPPRVAKAADAKEVATADQLLARLRDLLARADEQYAASRGLAARAVNERDYRAASSALSVGNGAIREARAIVETLLEVEGELDRRATVNVLIAPQWLEIRAVLLETLSPYPEARTALSEALLRIGEAA